VNTAMPFKEGDFILIDYVAKVKETGELIDTSKAEVAKEHKKFSEEKIYEPLLVIIGEHRVVEGLEEKLKKMDVGEEKTLEIPPEKAYGKRDPSKVKLLPLREFARKGIIPKVGEVIEINGMLATIRNITGGRVIVDFNHPLAGKTLIYEVKIVRKIDDPLEKIRYLLHRRIKPVAPENFNIKIVNGTLRIEMPRETYFIEDIQYIKQAVVKEIERYVPLAPTVEFIETYQIKLPEVKAETKEESKSASSNPSE